ncbi:calpain clp-1-like [Stegastes partitus]|uniref:Calpain clp-1-like n=1 Tax=Stegastes partitus TaxID=144197 RepID=A0A9Y4N6A5_9TELE|nr:PREDICTED: calpain clp-1-like [Stegastes partitus]
MNLGKIIGEKVGELVADAITDALGGDKDEDDKKGGFLSMFGGGDKDDDKDKDKDKGGLFSFGDDKKKDDDDDKGGFFSKIFDRDDDKDKVPKKSGFQGLFIEHGIEGAAGGNDGEFGGGSEDIGRFKGQSVAVSDGDLFDDLMDVAEETSKGD